VGEGASCLVPSGAMLKALGLKLRLTLERLIASILWRSAGDLILPFPMLFALTRFRFSNSDGSRFNPSYSVARWMGGSNVVFYSIERIILLVR